MIEKCVRKNSALSLGDIFATITRDGQYALGLSVSVPGDKLSPNKI